MSVRQRNRDAILHVSTRNGTLVDTNQWHIPLHPNTLHGKSVETLYPIHAMVPNVFPNVRAPYNTFTVTNITAAGPPITVIIPTGFYRGAELAAAIQNALAIAGAGDLTVAFVSLRAEQNQFQITNTSAVDTYQIDPTSLERLLGVSGVGLRLPFQIAPLGVYTDYGEPNLAGERVVHIKSAKIGHTQALHSARQGTQDICLSVPLHTTVYGGMADWQPSDIEASKLDNAFNISLANGLDVSLWDSELDPLTLPANHEIELQFKVIHSANIH